MNKIETFLYNLVKKNIIIKNFLRLIYQRIMSLFVSKKHFVNSNIHIAEGFFFGFHDKTPWSKNNLLILAHKFDLNLKSENFDYPIEVGYFDHSDLKDFTVVGKTSSWNWQQGSMLQWVDDNIIFNDWDGTKHIARIVDKSGVLIKNIDRAVGAISSNGKYAVSYSFDRLNHGMKGYGYSHTYEYNINENVPKDSYLYVIDIENNESKKLFSIHEIFNVLPSEDMIDCYHFFTHAQFSPTNNRIAFYHRWYKKNRRLNTRLITCDINGGNIHVFKTSGMVSHYNWIDDEKIIVYCSIDNKDSFYIVTDKSDKILSGFDNIYTSDGHPQYNKYNKLVLIDTYPNRFRRQHLSVLDYKKMIKYDIGSFYSPLKYRNLYRCDLHPRWDRKGTKICVDLVNNKTRSMAIIDYNENYRDITVRR